MALPSDKPFDKTVPLQMGTQTLYVTSTRQAAEVLLSRWPGDADTATHRAARKACLDVLSGEAPARKAREALERAAKEAGILGQAAGRR